MNETLEVMARITDSKIKLRDLVDSFILITFDLPVTEAGNKARWEFHKKAAEIGAVCHTESVYLMPDSPEAQSLALKLAKTEGSEVVCWGNAQPLNNIAEITAGYDKKLKVILREISTRLDKMAGYKQLNQRKRCLQMAVKTDKMLMGVEAAVFRRGSEVMAVWVELLKQRYAQVVR
jgi:hypothetical protein